MFTDIVGVFLVLITATATAINYFFFRSQIEPNVIIYATSDNRRPGIIILVIENIGKGLAIDVKFSSDKTLPEKAFNTNTEKKYTAMSSGPIITGIPSLGPESKRIITWGQYFGLLEAIGDNVINIEVSFKSKRTLLPLNKIHKTVCPVDIRSFEGTDASDYNWDKKLYEEVTNINSMFKQLAKSLEASSTSNGNN